MIRQKVITQFLGLKKKIHDKEKGKKSILTFQKKNPKSKDMILTFENKNHMISKT